MPASGSKMNWLPGIPSVSSASSTGRSGASVGSLDQGRDEQREDDVDPAVFLRQVGVGDQARQRQDVGERRPIAEAGEVGLDRDPRPAHRVAPLPADADHGQLTGVLGDLPRDEPDRVRVQRPGETPIGRDQDDQPLAALPADEQRMILATQDGRQVGQDLVELLGVRPRGERGVLGALELARGDELHRPSDLLDVLHRADPASDVALASHAAAMTSRPPAAPSQADADQAQEVLR